jgi:hypothetical protein
VLSAFLTANTGDIGKEWFEAMSDSPEEALDEFDRYKWRNGQTEQGANF